MSITPELYEFVVKVVEEKVREIKVTREEFDKLRSAVEENSKAISQLREAVDRLAEAQAKSEERLTRLERAVDRLAEAQAKSEERLTRLERAVEENSKAISQLREAVDRLVAAVGDLRVQVGRLSEVVGFSLEDIAKALVPYWLKEVHGVTLEGELKREFLVLDGREVEVNLYAKGFREGRVVDVVGETKSRIYGGDVLKLYREVVEPLRRVGREVVAFMVGFVVHPSAKREAEERGILVIAAYEFRTF